ncbi:hypothetical protein ACFL96_00935 [Thermoproteota archaeon]
MLWQVVKGTDVLAGNCETSEIGSREYIELLPEDFITFKNTGKRSSNVAVTLERFTTEYLKQTKGKVVNREKDAKKLWELLKGGVNFDHIKGEKIPIIDEKNKLSPNFRYQSNKVAKFVYDEAAIKIVDYTLFQLSRSLELGKVTSFTIPGSGVTTSLMRARQERSPKDWCKTGRIKNLDCQNSAYRTQLWDVGTYKDLVAHRINIPGEDIDYDHIPSKDKLKEFGWRYLEEHKGSVHENQLRVELNSDKCDYWWSIAVPHVMHKQGSTFMESPARQRAKKTEPFLEDVREHMSRVDDSKKLQALGAFRYLFKCSINPNPRFRTFGLVPYLFFRERPELVEKINAFFVSQMVEIALELDIQKRE